MAAEMVELEDQYLEAIDRACGAEVCAEDLEDRFRNLEDDHEELKAELAAANLLLKAMVEFEDQYDQYVEAIDRACRAEVCAEELKAELAAANLLLKALQA